MEAADPVFYPPLPTPLSFFSLASKRARSTWIESSCPSPRLSTCNSNVLSSADLFFSSPLPLAYVTPHRQWGLQNFYYLRDADGSRKILEVRDTMEPADMRAHGRAMDEQSKVQRVGALKMPSALKNQGMQSTVCLKFTVQYAPNIPSSIACM